MNTNFTVEAPVEILEKLHVNVEYIDYNYKGTRFTAYYKGVNYKNDAVKIVAYLVRVKYNNTLYFEDFCDFNPNYFKYLEEKKIYVKQVAGIISAKLVFFKEDDHKGAGFKQLLPLEELFTTNNIESEIVKNNYKKIFNEVLISAVKVA